MKAGTTSLHHWLSLLPSVWMSRPKELDFFCIDRTWRRGFVWYEKHFRDFPIRGESSPEYADRDQDPGVARRIATAIPDVRLIYLVRDPIARTLSEFRFSKGAYWGGSEGLREKIRGSHRIVRRSLYGRHLEPFLDHHPRERILVIAFEDLIEPKPHARRRILSFLSLDSEEYARAADTPFPVRNDVRARRQLTRAGRVVDRLTAPWLRYRLWGPTLSRALVRPFSRPMPPVDLDPDDRVRLEDLFRVDAERLSAQVGEDFSARWNLGGK